MDLFVQVCIAFAALAFIVLAPYAVLALKSARKSMEQMHSTLVRVERQLDHLMQESMQLIQSTNQLAQSTNRLAEDLHSKIQSVDGLFRSANRVSEAVNEVTSSVKQVSSALSHSFVSSVRNAIDTNERKFSDVLQWVTLTMELYRRWQHHRLNKNSGRPSKHEKQMVRSD